MGNEEEEAPEYEESEGSESEASESEASEEPETSDEVSAEASEEPETSDEPEASDEVSAEESDEPEDEVSASDESDDDESDDDDEAWAASSEDADDIFGAQGRWQNASADDFEDDAGDWSDDDYYETATALFSGYAYWGDTAERRYYDLGFYPVADHHMIVTHIRQSVYDTTFGFYERDGQIVPLGFLSAFGLAALQAAWPALDLSYMRVVAPRHPLHGVQVVQAMLAGQSRRELPLGIRSIRPAYSVDLRNFATPVGDQGPTSRSAAFAWTHALEMLGMIQGTPFPQLSCNCTMLRFQALQGDMRDCGWAWSGGDGVAGTWQPGQHIFTHGTCCADLWPDNEPDPRASFDVMAQDAENYRIDADMFDVPLDEMKQLLSAGLPVVISIATGESFRDIGRDGVMSAYAPRGLHGYQVMLCVGYTGNYFIVKNSWGEDWGDGGYCYIPKRVLASSDLEAVAIVPRRPPRRVVVRR
jgi:Papain family cysteine protease